MGSNFLRLPGSELGFTSPNSTVGKAANNDPINNFLFGTARQQPLPTAGPYAGVAPTLASANAGYATRPNGLPGTTAQPGQSAQLAATFGPGKY